MGGKHRTGVYLYLLLRRTGSGPEEAKQQIEEIRPEAHEDCVKMGLFQRAEQLFRNFPKRHKKKTEDESENIGQDPKMVCELGQKSHIEGECAEAEPAAEDT